MELEEALRSGYDEPEMIRTLHLSSGEVQNIIDFLNTLPSGKPGETSTHKARSKAAFAKKSGRKLREHRGRD